jgi:hypothetical protein
MGGKQRQRNPLPDWAKEVLPPPLPPGVEVQVYRQRREDPKRWEYLGTLEAEFPLNLGELETLHAMELEGFVPIEETRLKWGGGEYQFRFIWRDEEGRKEQKRSRNGAVWGSPRPK